MDVLDFSDRVGSGRVPVINISLRQITKSINQAFNFSYGLFCLTVMGAQALWHGTIKNPPTKAFWAKVEKERTRMWSLSSPPAAAHPTFQHDFFINQSGHSTHYLVLAGAAPPKTKTRALVIFIHGYPDCSHMWQAVSEELLETRTFESLDSTALLAVDMPGYGGSGSVRDFGPSQVLGTLVQFIAGMRERYLPNGNGRVVIAAHDWGAVVSWRLAADAPEVADRFILANGPPTALAKQNVAERFALARAQFRSFSFRAAADTVAPCLNQLRLSSYFFIFALPDVLSNLAFSVGDYFFSRFVCHLGVAGNNVFKETYPKQLGSEGTTPLENAVATQLAGSLGPNETALRTVMAGRKLDDDNAAYPQSTWRRCLAHAGRGNVQTDSIRYYQEGLATEPWEFDAHTQDAIARLRKMRGLSAQPNAFADAHLRLAAMPKAPVRVVWGAEDPALDQRVMLAGIEDWVGGFQNVLLMKSVGHFSPSERGPGGITGEGTRIIAKCVADAVDGRR